MTKQRWSLPRGVQTGLRLATEVAPKWPSRSDSPIQILLKLFSVFDSARIVLSPSNGNPLSLFVERLGLEEKKNEQFVRLFFDTALYERFSTNRFCLRGPERLGDALGVRDVPRLREPTLRRREREAGRARRSTPALRREREASLLHASRPGGDRQVELCNRDDGSARRQNAEARCEESRVRSRQGHGLPPVESAS